MGPCLRWSSWLPHGSVLFLVLLLSVLCSSRTAAAQAQMQPQTDPTEAAAVNAILAKLGLKAQPSWNVSGNLCSGAATDDSMILDDNPNFNPAIQCDCTDQNGTICHVTKFKINDLAAGPIPEELRNLTHLTKLYVFPHFHPRNAHSGT
ncbi:probable LRR receptor-like serine/threonine-protein kinase At1g56130 [Lolium perenne]|uniref:probable LRR receptor-like serine/threonine-protein kinase At1g56130 n=1 Tax=Lolium perenne TaxID=4522 RepID=UPI003A9950A5